MKRFLSAALLAGGMLFTAGVAPAFADPGYFRDGVQLVGGDRDGGGRDYDDGFRDGGGRGYDDGRRYEEAGHRHGWRRGHWRRNCFWERVCFRDHWGVKNCTIERVCRRGW